MLQVFQLAVVGGRDGLFIVFCGFPGVRRRRRTELADLLPPGRFLFFNCSELRILGHAQRIIN